MIRERKQLGQLISNLRTETALTTEELAERSGITVSNLQRIENGMYSPKLDIIIKIAKALGKNLTLT